MKIKNRLFALSKKNVSKIIAFVIIFGMFVFSYFHFFYNPGPPYIEDRKELNVAIITDIHAGSANESHKKSSSVYPRDFEKNLQFLIRTKPDLIITLGDNVNDNDECHPWADKLKSTLYNFNVLWAKGNHDKGCFSVFNSQNYYYHDYNNAGWRIVMLDDDIDIDPKELLWLKDVLQTDKKVLIATHVPFFSPSRNENALLPQYADVEKVISESGNVKYVFMGHLHSRLWDKIYNGVHYFILPSVSGNMHPQYFMELVLN